MIEPKLITLPIQVLYKVTPILWATADAIYQYHRDTLGIVGLGEIDSHSIATQEIKRPPESPAGRSWSSLPDLDLIASQTRLIIRNSRKFTAAGFLQSLLSSVVTGLASLNQIAGDLRDRNHPGMARQSIHQRFDIRSTAFLMAILCDLMQQRYSTAATAIKGSEIELREAWWLTRLPLTTGVMLEDGKSLEKLLKSFRGDIIDLDTIVGAQGKKCRLVAMRAAPEVAAARRAERRKKARECGKSPCPKGLIRDGWHLMLTNLGKEQADVSQLAAIYRARWAVEIQFRAWKQALNLGKALNRKSGEHHLQALVMAGMIAHQLGMKIAQRIGTIVGRARLSYEKRYDLLAVRLIKASTLAEVVAFDPDPRHVERDKRIRKSPVESGILALT